MPELFYHNPAQNIERGENAKHTIEVRDGDELIGGAEIEYFSKPLPVYQVSHLWVEPDHQGKGYSTKVMAYIERMLKQKGRAGVLVDSIDQDSLASGLYARRGWLLVPDSDCLYVYNLPKGVEPKLFQEYVDRQTPIENRTEKSKMKRMMLGENTRDNDHSSD